MEVYIPARSVVGGMRAREEADRASGIVERRAMRGGRARTEPSGGAPRSFMNGPRRLSHIWKRRVDRQPIPALWSPINAPLCSTRVHGGAAVCGRTHAPLTPTVSPASSSLRATASYRHLCNPTMSTLHALLPSPDPPRTATKSLVSREIRFSPPLRRDARFSSDVDTRDVDARATTTATATIFPRNKATLKRPRFRSFWTHPDSFSRFIAFKFLENLRELFSLEWKI